MNTYSVGDLVTLTATFMDANGNLAEPTTVTFTVKTPNGQETQPAATNPSTGVYTTQVNVTEPGIWMYRVTGTGAAQASLDASFNVRDPLF